MRAATIFSALFATAAIAAPILDGTTAALSDKLTTLSTNLDTTVSAAETTVTDATTGILVRSRFPPSIETAVPAGLPNTPTRRLLALSDLTNIVNGALTDISTLTVELTATISDLTSHTEDADIAGILSDIERLANEILLEVQGLVGATGLGLDLSELNPALAVLSNEIGGVIGMVQGLVDAGVTGGVVEEVRTVLGTALGLVGGLMGSV